MPGASRSRTCGHGRGGSAALSRELKGKAIEPQAVVTITRNRNNTVTVTGEVTNGALLPRER